MNQSPRHSKEHHFFHVEGPSDWNIRPNLNGHILEVGRVGLVGSTYHNPEKREVHLPRRAGHVIETVIILRTGLSVCSCVTSEICSENIRVKMVKRSLGEYVS